MCYKYCNRIQWESKLQSLQLTICISNFVEGNEELTYFQLLKI